MNFDERVIERLKRLEREVERLRVKEKQVFVPLATPLTSTAWDGDSYSTTAKTLIDLSAVFGVPAGVKAILAWVAVRDSGSAAADTFIRLSPNDYTGSGLATTCHAVNDRYTRDTLIVPCNSDGDIYYQIQASGTNTLYAFIQIWGYWL